MIIHIDTNPELAEDKISAAAEANDDFTVQEDVISFKGKRVAKYVVTDTGVEVKVLHRPWYISKSMIESKLRSLFA